MAAIDVAKIKETRDRKDKLYELLSSNEHNTETLEKAMGGWTNKREKSILFSMIRNEGSMPVHDGEHFLVIPIDDYPAWEEEQKKKALEVRKAPAKPKDPQKLRSKAEETVIKKRQLYLTAINRCADKPEDEILGLRAVIAQSNLTIAELQLANVESKLIDLFELEGKEELDSIANLNDLLPDEEEE